MRACLRGPASGKLSHVTAKLERFFAPDVGPAELRAIEQALAGLPRVERSGGLSWLHGRVHAEVGGLHCERIFGPLQRDACRCGKFVGEPARGLVCDRCHVEVGDPSLRATRWACLVTRCGVVHPALLAAAERELGCTIDLAALDSLAELDALAARTTHGLRVHRIPVAPASERAYAASPADPSGITHRPGPIDRMLAELRGGLAMLDRYHAEPLMPAPVLVAMHAAMARGLAQGGVGDATIWGPAIAPRRVQLSGLAPSHARRQPWNRPTRHLVRSMLWWGHDRLILEGRPGLRVLTIASQAVHEIAAGPCRLLGLVDDVLVVLGEDEPDDATTERPGLAAHDLRSGGWLPELPAIPLALFEKDQPEDACLLELAGGRIAAIENHSDRPAYHAHTPDLAHLWIDDDNHAYGRVHACRSGELALDLGMLPDADAHDDAGAVAIVHALDTWRVLLTDGRVFLIDRKGPQLVWHARRRPNAAAFSPDGSRLALVRGGTISIHDAEGQMLELLPVPR